MAATRTTGPGGTREDPHVGMHFGVEAGATIGFFTEVSGLVAIPPGVPPKGGWPVIAFGHGTTGVLDKCAPSQFDTLVGNGSMIASMIQSGDNESPFGQMA